MTAYPIQEMPEDERTYLEGYYLDERFRPVYTLSDTLIRAAVPYHRTASYRIGKTDGDGRLEPPVDLDEGEQVQRLKSEPLGDNPYANTTRVDICVVKNDTLGTSASRFCFIPMYLKIDGPPVVDVGPGRYTWRDAGRWHSLEIETARADPFGFLIKSLTTGTQYYIAHDLQRKGHYYHAITKTAWDQLFVQYYSKGIGSGARALAFWGLWPGSMVEGYSKIELKREPEPAANTPALPNTPLLPTPVVPVTTPTPPPPPASATPATKALSSNSRLSKEPSESGLSTAVIGLIIGLSSAALGAAVFVAWRHWSKKQAKIK